MPQNRASDTTETDDDRTEGSDRSTLEDFLGFDPESFEAVSSPDVEREDGIETRVGHWEHDDCDVYIGRDGGLGKQHLLSTSVDQEGWLGDPHRFEGRPKHTHTRAEANEQYAADLERRIDTDPAFREALLELEGSVLGCWCRRLDEDEPSCHGDVIVEMIERLVAEEDDIEGKAT